MPLRKVTGYQLRQQRQALDLDLKVLLDELAASLYVFKTDNKRPPLVIADEVRDKEDRICAVEALQAQYNLMVRVTVGGKTLTLCEAVKRVGPASRLEKLLRGMAAQKKDRYSSGPEMDRDNSREYAQRSITVEEAKKAASEAAWFASSLRAVVATANNTEVELDVSDGILQ